ncbi:MAG: 4-hydroxy-tetrahydrodipicolinate reductase [Actinobacteria bacterium]|nr:4-hydroxy-tetrahydrodipicolinate reductase [Actinomycetota bacterium]
MIPVVVFGAAGRMGRTVVEAVNAQTDMRVVAGVDPVTAAVVSPWFSDAAAAVQATAPQVAVDFSRADAAAQNALVALDAGVSPVIGTTGMSPAQIEAIAQRARARSVGAVLAPNFAIGAVLMMEMAKLAAPYLDHVEVIELHHDGKIDAPSGTAARTAHLIVEARGGKPAIDATTEKFTLEGVRGGVLGGVRVHSVRLPGFVAHQEVIFGGKGQTLTIRHDSTSRDSFMPGVLLAIRRVRSQSGLVVGLEKLLFGS